MVQKKVSAKKVKKEVATKKAKITRAPKIKAVKKPLTNGYSKAQPIKANLAGRTKKVKESKSPESSGNAEETVKSENVTLPGKLKSNKKIEPSSSTGSSADKPLKKATEKNPKNVDEPEETASADAEESQEGKVSEVTPGSAKENPAKTKKAASATIVTSRKRKQVTSEEPEVIENKPTPKSKTKKGEIVLEVPSLSSISGKVFVVGENGAGQLGLDEDVNYTERPSLLDLAFSIVDIAAGGMHSVCLTENGEVLTFGCNDEGALGRLTSDEQERIPTRIEIPEKIVQVSAGDSHTAALAESGQVYIWGNFRSTSGRMGLRPDGQPCIAPVKVLTNKTIVKIASGADHLACLSSNGTVYTCGCGEQGQLGRVNPRSCQEGGRKGLAALLEPESVPVKQRLPISDVWTESHATFLKAQGEGSIYACGLNNYNQLGFENRNSDQENQVVFFPKHVSSFDNKNWNQINGGQHHTLALDSTGSVHALGRSDYGRLGLGASDVISSPTVIPTLEKCNNISCGNCVSYAVTEAGELYSWGMGSSQLGHGESANEQDMDTPRLVKGKKGELEASWQVMKVSGGGQHALILASPKQGSSRDKKA